MRMRLSWILSLKFSKICSLMRLISWPSSIFPQGHTCPYFLMNACPEWIGWACTGSSLSPFVSNFCFNCYISCLRSLMMFLYSLIWIETNSLLVIALVFIFLARFAYFKLFIVSSNCEDAGEMFEIITVLQLPPKLSFSSLVSFESL